VTLSRLPLLDAHRAGLEKCVYCPKLCRAACPVSSVEAREAVIPWGKMSLAYFAARGDVPVDAEHADPAWACTGCFACREACDHRNEVAATLTDARAAMFAEGVAPETARGVAERFAARAGAITEAAGALGAGDAAVTEDRRAPALLVGCSYMLHAPEVARDAIHATARLVGEPVRLVGGCCGLPLLHAGDRPGFLAAARALAADVAGARRLVAVDPGCARTMLVEHARLAVPAREPELFVDLAHRAIDKLARGSVREVVRYHDPCQLGRGLGRYDEPRALLERATGAAPLELYRAREGGVCSGGGGLLPVTRRATSRAIADARIAEHRAAGGGLLVTACAESLRRFRSRGQPTADLATIVARALDRA
jgi:Fe-S oxidoreductase